MRKPSAPAKPPLQIGDERTNANLKRSVAILAGPFGGVVDFAQQAFGRAPKDPTMGQTMIVEGLRTQEWTTNFIVKKYAKSDPLRAQAEVDQYGFLAQQLAYQYPRDARSLGLAVPTSAPKRTPLGELRTELAREQLATILEPGRSILAPMQGKYAIAAKELAAHPVNFTDWVAARSDMENVPDWLKPESPTITPGSITNLSSFVSAALPVLGTVVSSAAQVKVAKSNAAAAKALAVHTNTAGRDAREPTRDAPAIDLGGWLNSILQGGGRGFAEGAPQSGGVTFVTAPGASAGLDPLLLVGLGVAAFFAFRYAH